MSKTVSVIIFLLLFIVACDDGDKIYEPPELYPYTPIGLSIQRTSWHISTPPDVNHFSPASERSILHWHNTYDATPVEEIYQNADVLPSGGVMRPLRLTFQPIRGFGMSWANLVQYIPYSIHDTTRYFEIRLKMKHHPLYIDFGMINEDVNGNQVADTEDKDFNQVCDDNEDVGLDGLPDELEPGYDPIMNPDPNGDNFYFKGYGKCPLPDNACDSIDWDNPDHPLFYSFLNGTEGNVYDPATNGYPDKESLAQYGFNTMNVYYTFMIHPDSSTYFVEGSEHNGWKTYRIPFQDITQAIHVTGGVLTENSIKYIRLNFITNEDPSNVDTVEIAHMFFDQDIYSEEPGPTEDTLYIRDFEYYDNCVFDLGNGISMLPSDSIIQFILYETALPTYTGPEDVPVTLFVNPNDTTAFTNETISLQQAHVVDVSAYQIQRNPYSNQFYILFQYPANRTRHLGYYLELKRGNDTLTFGDVHNYPHKLTLLYPNHVTAHPSLSTWPNMWRNAYRIPKNYPLDELDIRIFKGAEGIEGDATHKSYQETGMNLPYIEITGLDQYNHIGQAIPDNYVDDRYEIYRPDWGLLFFPHRTPFDTDTLYMHENQTLTEPLEEVVPTLYEYYSENERINNSIYYLRIITQPPPVPIQR